MMRIRNLFCFFLLIVALARAEDEEIRIYPPKGERLSTAFPVLKIVFSQKPVKTKLKLWLNRQEITDFCLLLGNTLVYQPSLPLPEGENVLELKFSPGKKVLKSNFFVLAPYLIDSLTFEGNTPLYAGQKIEVFLKGKAGGKAFFAIGDLSGEIPLPETAPGDYFGVYRIKLGDYRLNAPLKSRLTLPTGESQEFDAKEQLNILGKFFQVKLLTPRDDEEVGRYFDISGETLPDCEVRIEPVASLAGMSSNDGDLANKNLITTLTDEQGFFKVRYGFPIKISGIKFNFKIYARNKDGYESLPINLEVKVK